MRTNWLVEIPVRDREKSESAFKDYLLNGKIVQVIVLPTRDKILISVEK